MVRDAASAAPHHDGAFIAIQGNIVILRRRASAVSKDAEME